MTRVLAICCVLLLCACPAPSTTDVDAGSGGGAGGGAGGSTGGGAGGGGGSEPDAGQDAGSLVDECATGTDTCSADATCVDLADGFSCSCNGGFAGDGGSCVKLPAKFA